MEVENQLFINNWTLLKPTSGDIKIDDESIAKLPDLHASNF